MFKDFLMFLIGKRRHYHVYACGGHSSVDVLFISTPHKEDAFTFGNELYMQGYSVNIVSNYNKTGE